VQDKKKLTQNTSRKSSNKGARLLLSAMGGVPQDWRTGRRDGEGKEELESGRIAAGKSLLISSLTETSKQDIACQGERGEVRAEVRFVWKMQNVCLFVRTKEDGSGTEMTSGKRKRRFDLGVTGDCRGSNPFG